MKRAIFPAVLGVVLASCTGDYVNLSVQVVIPADVPTIQAGQLYLSLWSYDPGIADVGATLTDRDQASFNHTAGQRSVLLMHVAGRLSGGWRHYITVEGCQGSDAVLWDGIQGVEAPREVEMQFRTTPVPCEGNAPVLLHAPVARLPIHDP